jgi:hypothetical protein
MRVGRPKPGDGSSIASYLNRTKQLPVDQPLTLVASLLSDRMHQVELFSRGVERVVKGSRGIKPVGNQVSRDWSLPLDDQGRPMQGASQRCRSSASISALAGQSSGCKTSWANGSRLTSS